MLTPPHRALFEASYSALLLRSPMATGSRAVAAADFRKSSMDKNFGILRELGRHVGFVEHGADLADFGRCPAEIPI